jgi:putative transposase
LLSILRYIERNPLRSNLVSRAEEWQWSSLHWCGKPYKPAFLCEGPINRPLYWLDWVNAPQTEEELAAIRCSIERGRPFGERAWVDQMAKELGLEASLRAPGRPRKRGHSEFPGLLS